MSFEVIPIASGSKGNATLLMTAGENILIDFGVSTRRMVKALSLLGLNPENLDGILITHEHSDHINGLDTFTKQFNVPIYMPIQISRLKRPFLERANIRLFSHNSSFSIGGTGIVPFEIPHDSIINSGFRIESGGMELGYATDIGEPTVTIYDYLEKTDILYVESNHDRNMLKYGPYPDYLKERITGNRGHISNTQCRELVETVFSHRLKHIFLAHLSETNNTPQLALSEMRGLDLPFSVAPVLMSGL